MAAQKKNVMLSLLHLLRRESAGDDGRHAQQLELIRATMLSYIETVAQEQSSLERKIRMAKDVQVLWYLRSDLMAMLAGQSGESAARTKMEEINHLFQGALPRSLKSRPSSLGV
jgi:hypothetical protein